LSLLWTSLDLLFLERVSPVFWQLTILHLLGVRSLRVRAAYST